MSIVAYYARLSPGQLDVCAEAPDLLLSGSAAHLSGAEVIDIDRSWEPMAWLVSSCKRIEHEHNNLVMEDSMARRQAPKPSLGSRIAGLFKNDRKSAEVSTAIHESLRRVEDTPADLPLIAIEGRTENRDERLDLGMGAAAVFPPDEVAKLNSALAVLTTESLKQQYDPALMDRLNVFPAHWVEEGCDLLENYVLANFLRLQSFYANAAKNQQTVVMWYV